MTRSTARHILATFAAWRERRRAAKAATALARRIAAANPEIVSLQAKIAEHARRHRKVEPLRGQLRNLVNAQLAKEQGRSLPERIAS
ncbi:hypothetical protein FHT98_0671 [Bosea sp. AK1]|uniref:hypothetical protein n=1 Tax=Bosea sp. AK1 TaxID=2587160 RepID=UPI001174A80F|nr:hypothetical protein [Bosea sp. AK1]TQI72951.1 hypothetical protein FHT98_0671 [Bosea sp. AK1]